MRIFCIFWFTSTLVFKLTAQTTTNSSGSGTYTNTTTWTSPANLTGEVTILDGNTVTIPDNINQVYSNKINFTGTGKLVLSGQNSKWVPATNSNANPPMESFNNASNWSASTIWAGDPYGAGQGHYSPWIDSYQAWSAGSANNLTDYLQYDLKSPRWVQGIFTQGRNGADQWVTSAKVEGSIDGINWSTAASVLNLNSDQNTKVSRNFPNVMFARYVRVTPIGVNGHASMRMGILLRDNVFKSCNEIKTNFPNATSGIYVIDPDGTGTLASTSCYCDMTTDGGGWTLVLNYLHKGNATITNPALVVKTTSLPLLGSTTLGTDESASTTTWGHVSNAYLNTFTFTELRFYGSTSAHNRIIHFKTTHSGTINYFKTGSGNMSGVQSSFTLLNLHTAFLPNSAANFFDGELNNAMTNFPFWLNGTYHWGIKGGGNRWEVDDFPNNSTNSTFHQIWIR